MCAIHILSAIILTIRNFSDIDTVYLCIFFAVDSVVFILFKLWDKRCNIIVVAVVHFSINFFSVRSGFECARDTSFCMFLEIFFLLCVDCGIDIHITLCKYWICYAYAILLLLMERETGKQNNHTRNYLKSDLWFGKKNS